MKKYLMVGLLVLVLFVSVQPVFADINTNQTPSNPYNENKVDKNMSKMANRVWNTVANIVRMVAVGCIVFAGLRYMFSSADQKADIKQGLIYLAIGSVLVFGASYVLEFVVKMFDDVV